jgi:hypothetical protein
LKLKTWVGIFAGVVGLATPSAVDACGGGGVVRSTQAGSIGANAQRVFLSVHDDGVGGGPDGTDVITQIGVPDTTEDYGALLPLPSEPTLDPVPVSALELEVLDAATAPRITTTSAEEDSGDFNCGCPFAAAGESEAGGGGAPRSGAKVSEPVNIGPVTAVVLSGTSDAVNAWLADNGFVISAEDQAIIEEYTGYYFVAIRRNDRAAPGGPTSIGIHFTMPGDHRELPFRFARIGAASTVAFTVFVSASEPAGPSPPFEVLTLGDLDSNILRAGNYARAVRTAVEARGDKAFVLEARITKDELPYDGGLIGRLVFANHTVTRMSTILPLESLTEDAHFTTPYEGDVPNERHVNNTRRLPSREAGVGLIAALVIAGALRRRFR